MIIYSNDPVNLLGTLLGFAAYLIVFYRGTPIHKMTTLLIFYPALIAVNYLTQDTGSRLFFSVTGASGDSAEWNHQTLLISTVIYAVSNLFRLLFWTGTWLILKNYLRKAAEHLTIRMWLIVDTLMLASFTAIFTIICFMPEGPAIVYPICAASILSSFGCIYLVSYIRSAMQTAYHAQELEMRQSYYEDRMHEEERVRRIYHDMKNHILVLSSRIGNGEETGRSVRNLQEQLSEYENYYHTGNDFLDIIIRDKSRAARARRIDFAASVNFSAGYFLDPLDISTIFGNALDNAIEASERLPEEQRLITVKADRLRDMLLISVENNVRDGADTSGEPSGGKKTSKKDSFLHGFGIPNIRSAAEKYDGQCTCRSDGGRFLLRVMLPIPEEQTASASSVPASSVSPSSASASFASSESSVATLSAPSALSAQRPKTRPDPPLPRERGAGPVICHSPCGFPLP